MEVEAADLYEQRGVRSHRERKFYRSRKLEVGPDLVWKQYFWNQSFAEVYSYIYNGIPNSELTEREIPVRDLELDPFAARDFNVQYSLNKKKRWLIDELMAEDPEKYQTETLRVSCFSTAATALSTRFSEVQHSNHLLRSMVTRGYHTVHKGAAIHKTSQRAPLREYTEPKYPSKYRRGRRIKKPEEFVEDEDDLKARRSEEDVKPHERRLHLAYALMRRERGKASINANHDISKAATAESLRWQYSEKPKKPKKPSVQKIRRNFWSFHSDNDDDVADEVLVDNAVNSMHRTPFEQPISDFIIEKITHGKRKSSKKVKEVEDYRPQIPQEPEQVIDDDEEKQNRKESIARQPAELRVEPLRRIDECEAGISNTICLPTTPSMFATTNAAGDLIVIREDGVFLNPQAGRVFEEYPVKPPVLKKRNSLSAMPTVAKGNCLKVMNPLEAENLALKLWIEENKPETRGEHDQTRPERCEICFSDGFLFALSSCGHFSCVDCWTHYVAHSIHDNCVPIKCVGFKCSELVPLSVLKCFVRQERVRRYEKQLSNRRLLQNDFFHCSRCESFLFAPSTTARVLVCDCGAAICRECREEAHEPLSCANMRKYADMLSRNGQSFHESAVAHVASGVRCPRCASLVDRTEGCNHMGCFCGHQFCYACGGPFTGSHYDCELEARREYALIDGAETIHPTIFLKCSFIRRKKNYFNLFKVTRRLEKFTDADTAKDLINRFRELMDFAERAYIHLYLSYQRVNFKRTHILAHQFMNLVDQRLFFLFDRIEVENDSAKMESMLDSALAICDEVNAKCKRM